MNMKKGDIFAIVAKPVARFIDFFFATDLEHCAECAERRRIMNEQTIWQIIKLLFCKVLAKVTRKNLNNDNPAST